MMVSSNAALSFWIRDLVVVSPEPCLACLVYCYISFRRCSHLREGVIGRTICSSESHCTDFCVQTAMAATASKHTFLHCRVYEKLKIEMLDVTCIICPS
jgi:hypothetical protein